MKRILAIGVALAISASLAGCTEMKPAGTAEDPYILRIGTSLTETDPLFIALTDVFEKQVEEKTNNGIQVEIYSGSQLGSDEDVLEQAIVGHSTGIITDSGRLSNYVYEFGVLQAPYIASNYDEVLELLDTPTYRSLCDELEDIGFKILSFNYFQGERELFTKKPVTEPADLKGQRIRSSGSAVVTKTLEAMGANTTVLPWSESYQALQQQVIEGVEVHLSAAVGSSIQEVTDYLSFTGHQQLLTGLVVAAEWFENLPEDYQQILLDASYEAGLSASNSVIAQNDEYLNQLIEGGITVVDCDVDAFREACNAVYDELGYSEIKAQIDKEMGK